MAYGLRACIYVLWTHTDREQDLGWEVFYDKAILWRDDDGCEKEDVKYLLEDCEDNGIEIKKLDIINLPKLDVLEKYDLIFFDWGGMMIGNSMLQSFSRLLLEFAQDNPSKEFVMTSQVTGYAMKEAIDELPKEKRPFNIYLSVIEFRERLEEISKKQYRKTL